jgi:NADPH:quinone reductase-like Zn-dependent oxidoreductase
MKAAVIHAFGGPEQIRIEEFSTPIPGPGQVLVKVLAAGVNRLDHYVRLGQINRTWPSLISWAQMQWVRLLSWARGPTVSP